MASNTLQDLYRRYLNADPVGLEPDEIAQMLETAGVSAAEIAAARAAAPTVAANTFTPTPSSITDAFRHNSMDRSYMQHMSDSDLLARLSTADGGPRVQRSLGSRAPAARNILKPSGTTPAIAKPIADQRLSDAIKKNSAGSPANKAFKAAAGPAGATATANGIGNLGTGTAASGGLFAPGLAEKLNAGAGGLMNPQFDWNAASGVQGWGKNLGGVYNAVNGLMQSVDFAQGLGDISSASTYTNDLTSDILSGAMNNPMASYDLTPDQKRLLNQLKNGTYDSNVGLGDVDLLGALGNGLSGALMGLPGGVTGAIVGGLGGLLNSGTDSLAAAQSRKNAELEALYAALQESNQNYNNMRRQRMMANF